MPFSPVIGLHDVRRCRSRRSPFDAAESAAAGMPTHIPLDFWLSFGWIFGFRSTGERAVTAKARITPQQSIRIETLLEVRRTAESDLRSIASPS